MITVTPPMDTAQAETESTAASRQPSAYGGVLLLAKAWAALGGSERLSEGIRWQGKASPLLLFVLVVLPVLLVKSVLGVAQLCAATGDPLLLALGWGVMGTQRRLARFVASPRHDWIQSLGAMVSALVHHEATDPGEDSIVAVDSTTVEKRYGPKLPEIRPVYDAIQKRLVDGYEIVSACVAGEKGFIPVGLLPHRKAPTALEREALKRRRRKAKEGELPSKLDLALTLVATAVAAGVGAPTVVGDGAFAVMWWLREIAALGRHWLVSTRQDRRLRIGATIQGFRDWVQAVPVTLMATSETGTVVYGALLPEATLLDHHAQRKGLSCRPAYFERRDKRGKIIHRWFLVTSHLDWSLESIWLHWGWRWGIEQLHRDSKQWMLLSSFHVRSWEGIVALIACTSLRASLLYFMQAVDPIFGALSIEALVPALGKAACLVQARADGSQVEVSPPPSLTPSLLWLGSQSPLPAQWWPVALKAA